eukprot:5142638-Heterocapsa_arctica.AAC.1
MQRVLKIGSVATHPFSPGNSVAAGCHWADLLMRLALIDILDDTITAWPSVMAAVVADDVQIQAVGSTVMVARTISGAF